MSLRSKLNPRGHASHRLLAHAGASASAALAGVTSASATPSSSTSGSRFLRRLLPAPRLGKKSNKDVVPPDGMDLADAWVVGIVELGMTHFPCTSKHIQLLIARLLISCFLVNQIAYNFSMLSAMHPSISSTMLFRRGLVQGCAWKGQ